MPIIFIKIILKILNNLSKYNEQVVRQLNSGIQNENLNWILKHPPLALKIVKK